MTTKYILIQKHMINRNNINYIALHTEHSDIISYKIVLMSGDEIYMDDISVNELNQVHMYSQNVFDR